MLEGVFNLQNGHLWAKDIYAIVEYGYHIHFSINIWTRISMYLVVSPCLLAYRLSAK
jgi:hypothetical protein